VIALIALIALLVFQDFARRPGAVPVGP